MDWNLAVGKDILVNAGSLAGRISAQAGRTDDRQLRRQLLTAACDLLDHSLDVHRPPRPPSFEQGARNED